MATPLYRRIVRYYTAAIEQGLLKKGDWLPTLPKIAEQFECSLSPVRQALQELEHAGLIEVMQGKGSRVA